MHRFFWLSLIATAALSLSWTPSVWAQDDADAPSDAAPQDAPPEPQSPRIPALPPSNADPQQPPSPEGPGAPSEEGAPSLPGVERGPLVTPAGRRDDTPPPTEMPEGQAPPMMQQNAGDARPDGVPDADVLPSATTEDGAVDVDELPAPGESVGEGDAVIEVHTRGHIDDDYQAPLAEQIVELSVIQPPHTVVQTLVAVTDDEGIARFRADTGETLQAFARMLKDDKEIFAPTGVLLDEAGSHTLTIQDKPIVDDESVVFAPRIITIVELWEDYIVFTQIYRLATDQPVVFQAKEGGREAGFRIPVPEGATGVNVVQPPGQAESVGDAVMYRGKIHPAGEAGEAPTLIVRYSIKHSNVAKLNWVQEFPFDVENLSLVVPQISQHERHENLNVLLDVPLCDADDHDPDVMCFSHIDESAEGVDMLRGTAVRVAHSGTVRAGGRLEALTSGWPADPHYGRWAAGIAALGGLLLGVLIWLRGRRREQGVEGELARLKREREAILQRVDDLEEQLADAAILEMDYEAEKERIVGELALVERRIRGQQSAAEHG